MPSEKLSLKVTPRQRAFIDAPEREVLFGGAAGGGKSFGQLIDALLYALKYPGSKQLILRRTYPELEKSLIRVSQTVFPRSVYAYNGSSHVGRFKNGSLIDFGYSASEADVFQYQSAEYDVIRFDELTHFTEFQYVYMLSRLRGVNGYPKQIKSSTNPGGVGHAWVKERFIDPSPPDVPFRGAGSSSPRRSTTIPFSSGPIPNTASACSPCRKTSGGRSSTGIGTCSRAGFSGSSAMIFTPWTVSRSRRIGGNTGRSITGLTGLPVSGRHSIPTATSGSTGKSAAPI